MHTTATKTTPHTDDIHTGAEPLAPIVKASPAKLPLWAQTGFPIQTRLTINQPGDAYEQEADWMAEQVMRMSNPQVQCKTCSCGKSAGPDGMCAECKQKKQGIQRMVSSDASQTTAPPVVHQVLQQPGRPLDGATRNFMESRFGWGFGRVRVHTGTRAAESARAVNALAYTAGQNVVFGAGQYAPGTNSGRNLLAHELTHVVQQGGGELQRVQGMGTQSNAPSERDAEKMGALGTHGMGIGVSGAHSDETVKHGLGQAEVTRRSVGVRRNFEKVPLNFLSIKVATPMLLRREDPRLGAFLVDLRSLGANAIGPYGTDEIVGQIFELMRDLDLSDPDNLAPVTQVVAEAFPDAVLLQFLAFMEDRNQKAVGGLSPVIDVGGGVQVQLLTTAAEPQLPDWLPADLRQEILNHELPPGVTRREGTPPWGDLVVWVAAPGAVEQIEIYQEFPEDEAFYLDLMQGNTYAAHVLVDVHTQYNRDMKYFVDGKGYSPHHARNEIQAINDEVFRLVIHAAGDVFSAGFDLGAFRAMYQSLGPRIVDAAEHTGFSRAVNRSTVKKGTVSTPREGTIQAGIEGATKRRKLTVEEIRKMWEDRVEVVTWRSRDAEVVKNKTILPTSEDTNRINPYAEEVIHMFDGLIGLKGYGDYVVIIKKDEFKSLYPHGNFGEWKSPYEISTQMGGWATQDEIITAITGSTRRPPPDWLPKPK